MSAFDTAASDVAAAVLALTRAGGAVHFFCWDVAEREAVERALPGAAYARRLVALPWHDRGCGHYSVRLVPQHMASVACKSGKGHARKVAKSRQRKRRRQDAALLARHGGAEPLTWVMMMCRAYRGPKGARMRHRRAAMWPNAYRYWPTKNTALS